EIAASHSESQPYKESAGKFRKITGNDQESCEFCTAPLIAGTAPLHPLAWTALRRAPLCPNSSLVIHVEVCSAHLRGIACRVQCAHFHPILAGIQLADRNLNAYRNHRISRLDKSRGVFHREVRFLLAGF